MQVPHARTLTLSLALFAFVACGGGKTEGPPSFSLAWSEYPSWSVFGVAEEFGLIDGAKGAQGPIEKRWNVDIELKEAEYDPCLQMYGTGACDAVCITNMDVLNPSLSRASVAILPTSTSKGADALITVGIDSVQDLRGKKVYGLEKSVSEYCFVRNLELAGEKESDHTFTNMDPGAAALAMQQKQAGYEAIVVWNPFVIETLKKRPGAKVLFDSSTIPGEIVDMVVMSEAALSRPGGADFASAVIEAFYAINQRMAVAATRDETLVALGEKFSALDVEAMKEVVTQTAFYSNPTVGQALFKGAGLPKTMAKVVEFCVDHDIVGRAPSVGYGSEPGSNLRFDPQYMTRTSR